MWVGEKGERLISFYDACASDSRVWVDDVTAEGSSDGLARWCSAVERWTAATATCCGSRSFPHVGALRTDIRLATATWKSFKSGRDDQRFRTPQFGSKGKVVSGDWDLSWAPLCDGLKTEREKKSCNKTRHRSVPRWRDTPSSPSPPSPRLTTTLLMKRKFGHQFAIQQIYESENKPARCSSINSPLKTRGKSAVEKQRQDSVRNWKHCFWIWVSTIRSATGVKTYVPVHTRKHATTTTTNNRRQLLLHKQTNKIHSSRHSPQRLLQRS